MNLDEESVELTPHPQDSAVDALLTTSLIHFYSINLSKKPNIFLI